MEKELDFSVNKTQELTLSQLERTFRETYCDGTPVGVYHHADLINQILDIFSKVSNDVSVTNITAINNRDKHRPGVTILKELQEKFGEGSAESHLLRRLVCNISLAKENGNGEDYHLALSWYQGGCAVGIGPRVTACNNGCILNAEHVFSTRSWWSLGYKFGSSKEENLLPTLQDWASNLSEKMEKDFNSLYELKTFNFNLEQAFHFVGALQMGRVLMDSDILWKCGQYNAPLRQNQINYGCEKLLRVIDSQTENVDISAFELLNIFNESIKPSYIDAVELIPEQVSLYNCIVEEMDKYK